jgi:hypothetical protein
LGNSRWQDHADRERIEDGLFHVWDWVLANLVFFVVVCCLLLFVVVLLWLTVLWLSSRGKFMFLDGVVRDRAAVVEPWHRYRESANSLFVFRVVLSVIVLLGLTLVLGLFGSLMALSGAGGSETALPILIAIFGGLLIVCCIVVLLLIGLAIDDFIVPIIYLRDCRVGEAWRELGSLLARYPGSFALYVLLKIVVSIAVAMLSVIACCMTCCVVLIPYVGTVILLPIYLFLRAFPLYFLAQCGAGYEKLVDPESGASTDR